MLVSEERRLFSIQTWVAEDERCMLDVVMLFIDDESRNSLSVSRYGGRSPNLDKWMGSRGSLEASLVALSLGSKRHDEQVQRGGVGVYASCKQ